MAKTKRQTTSSARRPTAARRRANAARAEAAKQRRLKRELIRIGEYLISGGMYFWTGYLVFFITDAILGWTLWWAKLTANVVGWIVNYLLQRYWVFRNPALAKNQAQVTGRYIVITLVNFVLDYIIVWGLQRFGISPYIGQFISAGFFTVWNYLWYKTWVFTNHIRRHHHARRT